MKPADTTHINELVAAQSRIEELLKINEGLVHDHNALVVDGARLDTKVSELEDQLRTHQDLLKNSHNNWLTEKDRANRAEDQLRRETRQLDIANTQYKEAFGAWKKEREDFADQLRREREAKNAAHAEIDRLGDILRSENRD